MHIKTRYLTAGDKAIVLEFGNEISRQLNLLVRKMYHCISKENIEGTEEIVPTYRSLIIYYNPQKVKYTDLVQQLKELEKSVTEITLPAAHVTEIPVLYGGEYGPDLEFVAQHNKLSTKEVINLHTEKEYFIYMLGFSPGFAYLGGMSDKIATPRLEKPRIKVSEGSVGIAGKQTGIYPIESPGGWQIIGRTPIKLYDPKKEFPFLLKSGDYIKFYPINQEQFNEIEKKIDEENYSCRVELYGGFKVIKSGIFNTVQDLGRFGFQQYGMPVSGAMDSCALRIGNRLLGNKEDEAGIEVSTPGLALEALDQTVITITGANFNPTINNSPVPMWEAIEVKKGDIITFNQIKSGSRSYLLVAGSVDVPIILGSKSTYGRGKVGGLKGRPLKKSDTINIGKTNQELQNIIGRKVSVKNLPAYHEENKVRVILGPQDDYFTKDGLHAFLNSSYEITVNSDRMGYRLKGPKIESKNGSDIITDGIPLGSVQVPRNGMPIVMLADRQTTGGYAKIATVISVDIDKFAQMKPGNKVKFTQINLEEAHLLLGEREKNITEMQFEKKETTKLKSGNTENL